MQDETRGVPPTGAAGGPGTGDAATATPAGTTPPPPPPFLPPRSRPGPGPVPGAGRGPDRRRGGWGWGIAVVSVVVLGFIGLLAVTLLASGWNGARSARLGGGTVRHSDLRETLIEGAPTRDKIAVIDVAGVISSDAWDYLGNNLVTYIEEQLERAADDDHVRAIVLKIDSPGGEVLAADAMYKLILDFQEQHDKPVVASMGTVAASGGYYVAAPCRWIVANDLTITGSIGVIMQSYNWRGLMEKVGVRPQVFKSGEFKDMLSPNKEESQITDEERRIVQRLVDETFERFKSIVEEGRGLAQARNEDNDGEVADRGRQLAPDWKDYADGRLLSGKEAWKLGFVDELGDFAAAVERAEKLAGIEEAKLIQYLRPVSFFSPFRLLGRQEEARVKIDLGVDLPRLRAGLYFLAPHLLR